jgi:hypothetical protein
VLDALGVPNEDGKLSWPLGLRILPPQAESRPLRQQIDALLGLAASQALSGQANPRIVASAGRAVDQLHQLLRSKRELIPSAHSYEEADSFLKKLAKGMKVLQ